MNKLIYYRDFIIESKEGTPYLWSSGDPFRMAASIDIDSICIKYGITNYTINEDGTIDVDGNVDLYNRQLNELPLKFRNVSGNFYCDSNKLTNLEGSPEKVGGGFDCSINKLTSLVGSPKEVSGHFSCSENKLTNLVGSPKEVVDFSCSENKLTSLEGSPYSVVGGFFCNSNKLTSLKGAPSSVGGIFSCYGNNLTSLSGISKYIGRQIDCEYNEIRDVKGVPDGWRGDFYVDRNPVYEIFKFFTKERWDEVIEHLNDYNVIRDGKVVIMQALERVFWELDIEVPEIEEIEGYEIQF